MAGPMMNKTYGARNGARNAIAGREWSLNFLELLVAAGVRWVMRVAVSVDTDDLPSWVEKPGSSRPGRRLDRLAVWFFGLDGRRSTSELFELAAHLCKGGLGGLLT